MTSDDFDDPVTSFLDRLEDTENETMGLLQYQDGSWSVIDETGFPSEPVSVAMLEGAQPLALRRAAIDVDPTSVADIEIDDIS